ncbi:hypothetical protein [Amycolatopsis jejuensis]|uniref:hypothetical protein n=1 Tax=Amycolatopsis jejuensis TaxID=330084 RepID=UPI000525B1B7|nr:hypothetical protein [Amycolatopsis jejuensis]
MGLPDKAKRWLLAVAAVVALIASVVMLAVALTLIATGGPNSYPDPTMTHCRPQYGTCTEEPR